MKISLGFLFNAGLGAAAMYYFDPDRGTERRALLRDRLEALEGGQPGGARPRPARVRPPREHTELMQEAWSPAIRATGSVAGGTAALYGLGRGGFRGTLLGVAGLLLLARAATNTELRRLFCVDSPRQTGESGADHTVAKDRPGTGPGPHRATLGEETPVH